MCGVCRRYHRFAREERKLIQQKKEGVSECKFRYPSLFLVSTLGTKHDSDCSVPLGDWHHFFRALQLSGSVITTGRRHGDSLCFSGLVTADSIPSFVALAYTTMSCSSCVLKAAVSPCAGPTQLSTLLATERHAGL